MSRYDDCVEDDLYEATLACLRENPVSDVLKIIADAVEDYYEKN